MPLLVQATLLWGLQSDCILEYWTTSFPLSDNRSGWRVPLGMMSVSTKWARDNSQPRFFQPQHTTLVKAVFSLDCFHSRMKERLLSQHTRVVLPVISHTLRIFDHILPSTLCSEEGTPCCYLTSIQDSVFTGHFHVLRDPSSVYWNWNLAVESWVCSYTPMCVWNLVMYSISSF